MQNLRHHSLVAWQRADDLFIKLHVLTRDRFPPSERYELGSQMRRAAYSVPANIVEGFARRYRRARLHFLNIAEGSLSEVGYCVHVAHRLGYITDEMFNGARKRYHRDWRPANWSDSFDANDAQYHSDRLCDVRTSARLPDSGVEDRSCPPRLPCPPIPPACPCPAVPALPCRACPSRPPARPPRLPSIPRD